MNIKKNINLLHFSKIIIVTLFYVISILFSSCVTQRNLEYLQYKSNKAFAINETYTDNYRLKPDDELFIQIASSDNAEVNVFANALAQQGYSIGSIEPYGASLVSYPVDKNGNIYLPVIGVLSVIDKTLEEVSEIITDSLTNILSQPLVTVKLVNRYVSVLGEVLNPGHYIFTKNKLTIYDAIGLAGDITDYGNRKEVVLTRNENGKNNRIIVNLTDVDILSSEYYYIKPGDMIYVKPLRKKFWGMRQFPYSVVLSTITTAILIYNVIK